MVGLAYGLSTAFAAVAAVRVGFHLGRGDAGADVARGFQRLFLVLPLDEHRFRVAGTEVASAGRGACLEQHGGALRPRRHLEHPVAGEVLAAVVDLAHAFRVDQYAGTAVEDDRVVVPRVFPECAAEVDELVGDVVAGVVVVVRDAEQALGDLRGRSGHDVPPDPAAGERIERREASGGGEGLFERGRGGDDDAQARCRLRDRTHQQHRVVAGEENAMGEHFVGDGAVYEGVAVAVGEKEKVEAGVIERSRESRPVRDVAVYVGATVRVAPGGDAIGGGEDLKHPEVQRFGHAYPFDDSRGRRCHGPRGARRCAIPACRVATSDPRQI